MKIAYLIPKKIFLEKMSRVRFHQIDEIAKLCDLTYSGNGWDNYNDNLSVKENLKIIYKGKLPDLIIGFFAEMKGFKECPVPKVTMMNELHSPDGDKKAGLHVLLSAGYDFIICHHQNEMNDSTFDNIRHKMIHIPHHANTNIFKDYKYEKTIDVLLCGSLNLEKYKLRRRFVSIIEQLKSQNIRVEIHKHPGGYLPDAHTDRYLIDFAQSINKAKICLTCSSIHKCAFGKYIEIPMCNSILAGDIPDERQEFFESFMLKLDNDMSDKEITTSIIDLLRDENRLRSMAQLGMDMSHSYSMDNYAKKFMYAVKDFLKKFKYL